LKSEGVGQITMYRGTSLIRSSDFLRPYSRTVPRGPYVGPRGGAISYERGTPVPWRAGGNCPIPRSPKRSSGELNDFDGERRGRCGRSWPQELFTLVPPYAQRPDETFALCDADRVAAVPSLAPCPNQSPRPPQPKAYQVSSSSAKSSRGMGERAGLYSSRVWARGSNTPWFRI